MLSYHTIGIGTSTVPAFDSKNDNPTSPTIVSTSF